MRGRIRVVLADNAGCWGLAVLLSICRALVRANAINTPPGDYDPMLKIKDFGGSSNKQSSVMFNVMTHVPSHRFFGGNNTLLPPKANPQIFVHILCRLLWF